MKSRTMITMLLLAAVGCGKKSVAPVNPAPEQPQLILPAKDAPCSSATIVSNKVNSVYFNWSRSVHADEYELTIKNLATGETLKKTIVSSGVSVDLMNNAPYSWFVTARSNKSNVKPQSEIWRFYNPGPATTYYAPFPADLLQPASSESVYAVNGKITLTWKGSDADNDIKNYDVYLGSSASSLTLLQGNWTKSSLVDVPVKNGATYYWKVITRDVQGNTSDSGVTMFIVK